MPGSAEPRLRRNAAPLTQVAAGRARYGDAAGGRNQNGASAPRPPVRLAEPQRGDVEDTVAQRLDRAREDSSDSIANTSPPSGTAYTPASVPR